MKKIPFNKPFLIGKEVEYIAEAVKSGKISGNGMFTKKCHEFFEQRYGFAKVLLTTSCTDALEMAAILTNIQPGDEVIIPSYTFVSTANAFVLRGAKIIFADSEAQTPNLDASALEELITPRTKAIVVVHYAGVACDMDVIMECARQHDLIVIEDAAQAIDAYYKGKPLGSIGHLAAFSFHETKNIISGEGGMLVVNDERFRDRAEIIWEKGTNRAAFFRGEINKYGWVDVGSSFLPSEVIAAFLYAQLEHLEQIQEKRVTLWNQYYDGLLSLEEQGRIQLPVLPDYATNNGHLFYIVCQNLAERQALIGCLKEHQIHAVFHYLSLHESPFYQDKHDGRKLPNTARYMDCLLRLPMYYELENEEQEFIIEMIQKFFEE
ncbi:TDP-4-keto-6-deoxy-D-glucose transaminase [Candidatus Vecturithrix granuli]|uniref:TDP-4-keto-6-deoxy-D-glucose transaminase n=1 Tax=Vecturithrix granuli TaxID=1499967 RepID=A0A081C4A2_VECG1|nr:TDP-4-keto-6-deoxy-D-glucose transaminase [Candidatus Vecturithrix granuli]